MLTTCSMHFIVLLTTPSVYHYTLIFLAHLTLKYIDEQGLCVCVTQISSVVQLTHTRGQCNAMIAKMLRYFTHSAELWATDWFSLPHQHSTDILSTLNWTTCSAKHLNPLNPTGSSVLRVASCTMLHNCVQRWSTWLRSHLLTLRLLSLWKMFL